MPCLRQDLTRTIESLALEENLGVTITGYRYAVLAAGLSGVMKEGPSEALPAIGGIDSDVVDKKSFILNGEDYYPHDGSVAFGDLIR